MMRWLTMPLLLLISAATPAAPDSAVLRRLLDEFLAGANGAAVHEWFWADDLIYTGSGGRRVGKADILRDMRSAPAPSPRDPVTIFSSENVRIQQYGSAALVAFQLVGTTTANGTTRVARFLNTSTFVKREDRWQAVGWQATRMPFAAGESRARVLAAEADFLRAWRDADTTMATSLLDQDFVWTDAGGNRFTRARLVEDLGTRRTSFERAGMDSLEVRLHGEAALVRGRVRIGRGNPAGGPRSGAAPARAARREPAAGVFDYTLTLVSAGGEWKAVDLHTRRR